MYFNNKAVARGNEKKLSKQVKKAKTYEEQQVLVAMFYTTMVNYADGDTGYTQNLLFGHHAPSEQWSDSDRTALLSAVSSALSTGLPQVARGAALIPVDEAMRGDERFAECPVGSVVLFEGLVDLERWGMKAHLVKSVTPSGYFLSEAEFVVLDPVMAGQYLGGRTRYHGSEYKVGHLRSKRESLRLLNENLGSTYALAEVWHEPSDPICTVWLRKGMRFDLHPSFRVSRILTKPEDTEPMLAHLPKTGVRKGIEQMLSVPKSLHKMALAMTDVPAGARLLRDLPQDRIKESTEAVEAMFAAYPETCVGDEFMLQTELAKHGCAFLPSGKFKGSDDVLYDHAKYLCHVSGRISDYCKNGPGYYWSRGAEGVTLLYVLSLVYKYNLPTALVPALLMRVSSAIGPFTVGAIMSCEWEDLKALIIDGRGAGMQLADDVVAPILEAFFEPRLRRTRATYHDNLTQTARKKLLAKFTPSV
jgi:hypothetical protein